MQSREQRAEDYRKEAAKLRELAAKEPEGSTVGRQLLDLAGKYEHLATIVR